jgi:DNA-binding response OmpR family regulator
MARILVIDDELMVRTMLERILTKAGHEVVLAANGREGITQFKNAPADLVLVDVVMPVQDGLETIVQLRRESPNVGIITMSGKPAGSVLLDIAQRLNTATLIKPFSGEQLLAIVDQAVARKGPPGSATDGPH